LWRAVSFVEAAALAGGLLKVFEGPCMIVAVLGRFRKAIEHLEADDFLRDAGRGAWRANACKSSQAAQGLRGLTTAARTTVHFLFRYNNWF
jgi:hypothetical protein